MSLYDVALGLNAQTLDGAAAQLYASPQAREKLFKGSKTGQFLGQTYVASYDVQAAPTFTLAPPDAAHWSQSVTDKGTNPPQGSQPPANTFQLVFPTLSVEFKLGEADPLKGTAPVWIFGTANVVQDQASKAYRARLEPVSVWLDQSHMSDWDKGIVNLIIGMILTMAQQMLKGWVIPALTFSHDVEGIRVTIALADPPTVAIDQSRLLVAACLKSRTQPVDITNVQWPDKPLFALVSGDLIQSIAGEVDNQLKGKQLSGNGDYKSLLTYDYSATVNGLTVTQQPSDMTRLTLTLNASFSAEVKPLGVGGPCAISAAGASA